MGGGVGRGDRPVPAFSNNGVFENHHGSDRHFAFVFRAPRQLQRPAHERLVAHTPRQNASGTGVLARRRFSSTSAALRAPMTTEATSACRSTNWIAAALRSAPVSRASPARRSYSATICGGIGL